MKKFLIATAMLVALSPGSTAQAQALCFPRDEIVKQLEDMFGEHLLGRGLTISGLRLVELFVNEDEGSFTILDTTPDGISCVRQNGTEWVTLDLFIPRGNDYGQN